jgi:hypothetical protein
MVQPQMLPYRPPPASNDCGIAKHRVHGRPRRCGMATVVALSEGRVPGHDFPFLEAGHISRRADSCGRCRRGERRREHVLRRALAGVAAAPRRRALQPSRCHSASALPVLRPALLQRLRLGDQSVMLCRLGFHGALMNSRPPHVRLGAFDIHTLWLSCFPLLGFHGLCRSFN